MMSEELPIRHMISILDTNEQYGCSENQHLLRGMISLGKKGIPSGCHGGGCGVCKVQILKGKIITKTMSSEHISEEERKQGFSLACRSFPQTDISLKVIGKISKNVLKPIKKKYGFV